MPPQLLSRLDKLAGAVSPAAYSLSVVTAMGSIVSSVSALDCNLKLSFLMQWQRDNRWANSKSRKSNGQKKQRSGGKLVPSQFPKEKITTEDMFEI